MDYYNEIHYYKNLEKKFSIYRWALFLFFNVIIIKEFSSYEGNIYPLLVSAILTVAYLSCITIAAYNKKGKFMLFLKYTKYMDILLIDLLITIRCGLRSEIYILYFILILYNGVKYDYIGALQSSIVSITSYSLVVFLFTPREFASCDLFAVRIIYLILGSYVMYEISKMMSISNSREKEAREMAYRDPLTKLHNRLLLSQYFEDFKKRCASTRSPFCIALIDIDNFKAVNDTLGHIAGDYVLNTVANKLKENALSNDFLCRFGGEEFVLLIDNCSIDKGYQISNKICKEVASTRSLLYKGKITVSVGVCEYDSSLSMIENINNADIAMYSAKNNGKNRVMVYKDSIQTRLKHE